jgi:hypothetical protein
MNISSYLAKKQLNDSHEWIEQLMIFYNTETAKILMKKNQGFLRSQSPPDIEKLELYKSFGVELANKSASYVPPSENANHYGMNQKYCHATSPIRRFVDIINQMVLCNEIPFECSIDEINKREKCSKKYEREIFFLRKVLEPSRNINGIVLNDHRIWIPEWKRIITCENNSIPGNKGKIVYSVNMNNSTWKRRLVFRFEDTDCLEQQTI